LLAGKPCAVFCRPSGFSACINIRCAVGTQGAHSTFTRMLRWKAIHQAVWHVVHGCTSSCEGTGACHWPCGSPVPACLPWFRWPQSFPSSCRWGLTDAFSLAMDGLKHVAEPLLCLSTFNSMLTYETVSPLESKQGCAMHSNYRNSGMTGLLLLFTAILVRESPAWCITWSVAHCGWQS
jgi:hypothetical protein